MSSTKYPVPNDPAARALREARARFGVVQPHLGVIPIHEAIQTDPQLMKAVEKFESEERRRKRDENKLIAGVMASQTLSRSGVASAQVPQSHPITSAADLAPLIRASRKRMKMSQQQFADACGVGRRFLSELENGKASLEFDKVLACALGAGIDLSAKPRIPL